MPLGRPVRPCATYGMPVGGATALYGSSPRRRAVPVAYRRLGDAVRRRRTVPRGTGDVGAVGGATGNVGAYARSPDWRNG